jgi:hypothetical protein
MNQKPLFGATPQTRLPIPYLSEFERVFAQLSLPMRAWVQQQAQQIVRAGEFHRWAEMQLEQARSRVVAPLGLADPEAKVVVSILTFLLLTAVVKELNAVGDDAQLANIDLQNVLQKQQQTVQMISSISKLVYDSAMAVIRKIGG